MPNYQTNLTKDFQVSKLGFGCMSLSNIFYKTEDKFDDEKGIQVIKTALELGITHFDTAIAYGWGHNEKLLGKAIADFPRDKLQIATKTGFDGYTEGHDTSAIGKTVFLSGKPEFIRRSCLESLKRLNTDYIDLFYLHRIDTSTPIEETIGEMKKLVEEGKIRHIGLSEASPETLRRAHAVHPITAHQIEWSLWSRDVEAKVVPACRELGIGLVPYAPLGRGMLTGALKDAEQVKGEWRGENPRFQGENFKKNLEFVEKISAMAAEKGCTPGQLSLAWVLAQGPDVSPIPGTSSAVHLRENASAVDVVLSPEEVSQLQGLIPPESVAGDRYQAGIPTFKDN